MKMIISQVGRAVLGVALLTIWFGCSGPGRSVGEFQPLDAAGYDASIKLASNPRQAFLSWKSGRTTQTLEQVEAADAGVSGSRNPFDHGNPAMVDSGKIIYEAHCMQCHGREADGKGEQMKQALAKMNFRSGEKKLAVRIAGRAPSSWFEKVYSGVSSDAKSPDGTPVAMPPFKGTLAREQIWLAITYLEAVAIGQR